MSEAEKDRTGIPPKLFGWCRRWSSEIGKLDGNQSRISYMQSELPELLTETGIFVEILSSIAEVKSNPLVRTPTMFDSEMVLYRDPHGQFSVRMYLWEPGAFDPIHDHNSWGVIGTASGGLTVTTYRRRNPDCSQTRATLDQTSSEIVSLGDTYTVFPLEDGIHRTGNPGLYTIIQVGVYGENLTGRNYINIFHESDGRIERLFSLQEKKRMLAREALVIFGGETTREQGSAVV
ncbi:MAG TPA: hypothetical protein ENN34_04700 [Deltaproteobacteria bacterium]|nr:hypothetical protein [Deltaproteobacteria bacterium]